LIALPAHARSGNTCNDFLSSGKRNAKLARLVRIFISHYLKALPDMLGQPQQMHEAKYSVYTHSIQLNKSHGGLVVFQTKESN
jgi:hypothetical protein